MADSIPLKANFGMHSAGYDFMVQLEHTHLPWLAIITS